MPTDKERIEEQNKIIEELTAHVGKYEHLAHELRTTQNKLDIQVNTYGLIHKYTQMAFSFEEENLYNIVAEGVVDVFQVEMGAVYKIDLEKNSLVAIGSCNLPDEAEQIALPETQEWLVMPGQDGDFFSYESPVTSPIWESWDCSTVVSYTIINNKQQPVGIVVGGISKENAVFYEFSEDLSKSSFIVYCQQMNGISNNFDAIKQARQAGEAKTQFLANLSHEIRTPMNAILGMAKIAEQSKSNEEIMKCVKQIDGSAHHLLQLINDVLDISKVEEGKLSLTHKKFKLSDMIDQLLISIMPQVKDKDQKLIINKDELKEDRFIGDSLRLSQVLINILSNAVKFTPNEGIIILSIREIKKDLGKVLVMFSVSDTGIGIPEDQIESIFKPFEQADGSISRKYGGTGLGLAISQRIVELMGGEIKVQSEPDKGTVFSFNVWIDIDNTESRDMDKSLQAKDVLSIQDMDLTGSKIMVVDDVEINRDIIKAFLNDTKADVIEAEDGQQAIDFFSESQPGEYSLILMDVQMPVVDGCTATEVIRDMERPDAKTIPIFAMTANVFKEDVQKVVNAGMDGHIGKPIDYDSALITVVNAIKKNG